MLIPPLVDTMALAKTDGNFIVGNGSKWVAESGAVARTSLGLGASDSVTFGQLTVDNLQLDANTLQTTSGSLEFSSAAGNIGFDDNDLSSIASLDCEDISSGPITVGTITSTNNVAFKAASDGQQFNIYSSNTLSKGARIVLISHDYVSHKGAMFLDYGNMTGAIDGTAHFSLRRMDGTGAAEVIMKADSSGNMKFFCGTTPEAPTVGRQGHIADADGTLGDITSKFNTLLAYLENIGLIATS